MTRKSQLVVSAAAALVGLGVVAALWLTHETPPQDDPPAQDSSASSSGSAKDKPADPHALSEIRQAYQDSLAGSAPPGMVELMQGPGAGKPAAGDLPPLPDPFVVPAGHRPESSGSSGDLPPLPPLPPDVAAKSKPLPPPAEEKKAPKEAPASDLPPLPPAKK
jgi:hypothetical protein